MGDTDTIYAGITQPVEYLTRNEEVVGSNPISSFYRNIVKSIFAVTLSEFNHSFWVVFCMIHFFLTISSYFFHDLKIISSHFRFIMYS